MSNELDNGDANLVIANAKRIYDLEQRIEQMKQSFCQTVLAIITAMPDDPAVGYPVVRVAKFDYLRCVGRVLLTFVDPVNGDQVFVSRPVDVDEPGPPPAGEP